MLSAAKHLEFSSSHEDEILRLRLRMTLRHSLDARALSELIEPGRTRAAHPGEEFKSEESSNG